MRISDWSSDVCSSDLIATQKAASLPAKAGVGGETRPRGPAPVAGGTAGRNEVEHPERSEGLPQAASGLAGSAARTRLIGRGTSNAAARSAARSEEHTSELQSLMRISYAVFCLKKKTQ